MYRAENDRTDIMGRLVQFLWALCLLTFMAIKLAGTSLAAWSWWWILLPPVPLIGALVVRLGL
jgi:hypothetical protein